MKKTTPLESEEQERFCDYLTDNNILFTSTQNGAVLGGKKFGQIKKLKSTGMKNGFPDLILFVKNKSKTDSILFIEMKRQKGGVVSEEQKIWHQDLCKAGYAVGIARGCDSAIRILNKYLET